MVYPVQAITANGFGLILLTLLAISFFKKYKTRNAELNAFLLMIFVNGFQCVAEALTIILDGKMFPGAVELSLVLNTLLFMGNITFSTLWATYADLYNHKTRNRGLTFINFLKFLPAIVVFLASFVNLFTPVFFSVSPENVYTRTDWFAVPVLVSYGYIITGVVIAYGFQRRLDRYVLLPAASFMMPVVVASIFQFVFPGISLLWAGSALGLNSAFLSLLDEGSAIDPLSGAFSRHHLNQRLQGLADQLNPNALTAGIMLDIDNFKSINDRYGHITGDDAISNVGSILRQAMTGSGIVFRFAGDEFVILMPIAGMQDVKDAIERINEKVSHFNSAGDKPYQLSFSFGHTVYVAGDTPTDFISRMDSAMYEEKKGKLLRLSGSDLDNEPVFPISASRNRILLVDDDVINREILKNIFPAQYCIIEAANGAEGLRMVERNVDSLCAILLDYNMPEMDGVMLLQTLHDRQITDAIPTFLVTANDDYDVARQAYSLGVMDVISKPIVPFVILRRVQSVLELFRARESLRATVQDQERLLQENEDTINILHRNTIEALASAIEFRDVESGEHTSRIYSITKYMLANTQMGAGFTAAEIDSMAIGSIMHDIGKISISDIILNKPGKLTAEEFEAIKLHTVKGGDLLKKLSKTQSHPAYEYAQDIARHHHERWDGRGYPDGLKGDEITPWSQVVSIADVYDALVSPRVYKAAYDPDVAVKMICNGECGTFGPKLLACFLEAEPHIRKWYQEDALPAPVPVVREDISSQELTNAMLLIDSMRFIYDMIISVNLTKNTYIMMDHSTFQSHKAMNSGVFDELMEHAQLLIPSSHRQQFREAFYRKNLLNAYARGEKVVSLDYPEQSDDGQLRHVSTSVILSQDTRNGDILEITLTRYVDNE